MSTIKKNALRQRREFTAALLLAPTMLQSCANFGEKRQKSLERLKPYYDPVDPQVYELWEGRSTTNVPQARIEVTHFCGFKCGPCYDFEKQIDSWLQMNASVVDFKREAMSFRKSWTVATQLFYSLQSSLLLDRFYHPILDAAQKSHHWFDDSQNAISLIKQLDPTLDEIAFYQLMQSNKIKNKMDAANDYAVTSGISNLPSVLVNRRYKVDSRKVKDFAHMVDVINDLVQLDLESIG